ncbi:phage tail assembly protein [Brevibacillus laterosporus]|uniref:phage tail assembly protein n=1 Tax=Brevibacillus laterosporus TaxID=1465 RepID=UPI003D1982A7
MNETNKQLEAIEPIDSIEHKLARPITFEGEHVTKLYLDFDKLSGKELALCSKLARRRDPQDINPGRAYSMSYQITVAARAAGVAPDLIEALNGKDFTQVTQLTENFLVGLG